MRDYIITDLDGNSGHLTDVKQPKRKRKVNGMYTINLTVFETDRNKESFAWANEESIIEVDGQKYRIKDCRKLLVGDRPIKVIRADHMLFDLIDHRVYGKITGVNSITEAADFIFSGSGYTYAIVDMVEDQDVGQAFGVDNGVSMFQKLLEIFNVEYEVNNKHITMYQQIGSNSHFQFRYKHNIKTIEVSTNTDNLSTYIKGFGKRDDNGDPIVTAEYTSPLAAKYGIRHAPPVEDERFTNQSSLKAHLEKVINDEPEFSVKLTFAELRRAGYPYEVVNVGDTVYVIHEPLGIDINARVMEFEEDLNEIDDSVVTISNIKKNITDVVADLGKTEKAFKEIVRDGKIKHSALDEAVQRATKALNNSLTELEYPENGGIVARDPNNPNRYLVYNSAGLGLTEDGGQSFKYAITHDGINAEVITVGYMLFNYLKGGTLTLGGQDNGNGIFRVMNETGEVIAELDAGNGGFEWLRIGDVISDSVVKTNYDNLTLYCDPVNGSDRNSGLSTSEKKSTIQGCIDAIPNFNAATITIVCTNATYRENIFVTGLIGNGVIDVDLQSSRLDGNIQVLSNMNRVNFSNFTLNSANNDYASIEVGKTVQCTISNAKVYSRNSTLYGISAVDNSFMQVIDSEVYDTVNCIRAGHGSNVYVRNCKGLGDYGLTADYVGTIGGTDSAPAGTISNARGIYGGEVRNTFTHDSGAATPPAPPEKTERWKSSSVDNWSSSGYWGGDGAKQGNWGYGRRTGYWFFGSTPSNSVTGKSISRMRVHVKRANSGGYSSNVTIYIRSHSLTSKPGSASNMYAQSSEYKTVNLAWGESAWVELPSSMYANWVSGHEKGIGIYAASDSGSSYAVMEGQCTLEITYA